MSKSNEKKKTPEVIEDKELDQASGGLELLLPQQDGLKATLSCRKTAGDGNP